MGTFAHPSAVPSIDWIANSSAKGLAGLLLKGRSGFRLGMFSAKGAASLVAWGAAPGIWIVFSWSAEGAIQMMEFTRGN